jgi:hypothetical protein
MIWHNDDVWGIIKSFLINKNYSKMDELKKMKGYDLRTILHAQGIKCYKYRRKALLDIIGFNMKSFDYEILIKTINYLKISKKK